MSAHLQRLVRDRHLGDATLKHVLVRLAMEADDAGRVAVSLETLADDCDLVKATIRRALRTAERLGVLRLQEREYGPWPRDYRIDAEYLYAFPLTRAAARRRELLKTRGAA